MTEFKPIIASATYEIVAENIRRAIMLGRFVPGEKLPRERELARQLNVSRATLREAIRILVAEDLVEIRRGATGGTLVRAQEVSPELTRRMIREQEENIQNVASYRLAIEAASVRQAAARRSAADLQDLHTLVKRMNGLTATPELRNDRANLALFIAADSAFHVAIAQASRNPYFVRAVEEIRIAMWMPVAMLFTHIEPDANDHHEAIYRAIEAADGNGAARRMIAHIEEQVAGTRRYLFGAREPGAGVSAGVG